LGSAFNPPHIGHLVLAQEAASQLGLERVLLVPTGRAPHKEIEDDPGADIRLEMARRAAASRDGLEVSEVEVARDEPSYTFRTLELLGEERPGAELVWLMGTDAAIALETWKEPERIVKLARLGIAERPGVEREAVEGLLDRLGRDGAAAATFLEMPQIGVSSSMVRDRVRAGRPVRFLVPDGVVDLIVERGLYRP
jgi:nicotinate-nucleotide adenylyltransferase